MALDEAMNFAKATVTVGNYDDTSTSIVVSAGHGARFPTPPFNVTWWNVTDYADPSDDPDVEIVRVTAISTDTLTVTRAQEGTSATEKNISGKAYQVIAGLTAKVINDDIPQVSGSTGAITRINSDGDLEASNVTDIDGAVVMSPDSAGGASFDGPNSLVKLGDINGNVNGTVLMIDDANQKATLNKAVLLTGIPGSDPAVVGSLYYDPVTGIVKRSAG
jgi:hypothetical protein